MNYWTFFILTNNGKNEILRKLSEYILRISAKLSYSQPWKIADCNAQNFVQRSWLHRHCKHWPKTQLGNHNPRKPCTRQIISDQLNGNWKYHIEWYSLRISLDIHTESDVKYWKWTALWREKQGSSLLRSLLSQKLNQRKKDNTKDMLWNLTTSAVKEAMIPNIRSPFAAPINLWL